MRIDRPSWLSVLVAATLLVAGCGGSAGLTAAGGPAPGAMRAMAATQAKPTLEQAFEAAQGAARKVSRSATQLCTAGGYGVGRDGRLLTAAELAGLKASADPMEAGGMWMFSFRRPNPLFSKKGEQRLIDVHVDAAGQVRVQESTMLTGIHPWTYRPSERMPLARAMQLAIADGLQGEVFHINLAPADGQFFGARPEAPLAPPSYLIGTGPGFEEYRQVSVRSGLLHQEPSAADLELVRRMMVPVVNNWHASLTLGAERPVTREDLLRAGMDPRGVDSYIAMFDRDGDRQIATSEFLAQFSTPRWLKAWREFSVKFEYYRADRDQDERLTAKEAAQIVFTSMGMKGEGQAFPLPVAPAEFAQADANGDGSLDLNEYLPLGTLKTLRLLELEPKAANSFFFIQTKPWSH